MQKIGFIGLGLMGYPMARNIAQAGFPLTVYNRTRSKAEALAAEVKATVADTPHAVAAASDIVISMVSDVPDVEQVYFGAEGVLEAVRPGLICVDMGTVGADCAKRVAARLAEHGAGFLDAPVSGGVWGAQQGTLSIMTGGSESDFQAVLPVFEAMGKKIVHCGPVGAGQTTKLVNQVVGAINLEAVCEGLKLAEASGADVSKVLDAVGAGAAGSWSWANLGPRIQKRDFEPGFKIAHQLKDLRLALEAAESAGINLPGLRLVIEHTIRAQAALPDGENRGSQGIFLVIGTKE
jgi:3-hydroxyisobutyrate dehydrogenase